MLLQSEQYKIVDSISLSFRLKRKISSGPDMNDKYFLNPSKYETTPKPDFTFLVLWMVFTKNLSKQKILQTLQTLDKKEKNTIINKKTVFITYNNTFNNDIQTAQTKVLTPDSVYRLYINNTFSIFYFWWYFRQINISSRIQQRAFDRVDLLLDYFPKIKHTLNKH